MRHLSLTEPMSSLSCGLHGQPHHGFQLLSHSSKGWFAVNHFLAFWILKMIISPLQFCVSISYLWDQSKIYFFCGMTSMVVDFFFVCIIAFHCLTSSLSCYLESEMPTCGHSLAYLGWWFIHPKVLKMTHLTFITYLGCYIHTYI